MNKKQAYILWFDQIRAEDTPYVGGKNANLGEMYSVLTEQDLNVPNGFCLTAKAYWDFLDETGLRRKIKEILADLDTHNVTNLRKNGEAVREAILEAELPQGHKKALKQAYGNLCKQYGANVDVAVRSSATAEDLPSISGKEPALIKIGDKTFYEPMDQIYQRIGNGGNLQFQVPSMKNSKVVWQEVEQLYRHKANGNLYKITTASGREITISADHSLIVLDEDNLEPKVTAIDELSGNEKVPVTEKIQPVESDPTHLNVLDYLKENDVKINQGKVKITNNANNWKIQNGLNKKIPINQDFMYFLGIYLAEGSTYKNNGVIITNSNPKIMSKIKSFFNSLDLYKGQKLNKHSLRVYCKALVRLLHKTCGSPSNKKGKGKLCRNKKVPNFVFSLKKNLIAELLKGCFDGDGYVISDEIGFTSTSKLLAAGIAKLLEILEINFSIRYKEKQTAFTIIIPSTQAEKFKKLIGFTPKAKKEKLQKLIKTNREKSYHPRFNDIIDISKQLQDKIKKTFDAKVEKQTVEIATCPDCKHEINKSSDYKQNTRYYCEKCGHCYYENDVLFTKKKKNINYNNKGQFEKGSVPWNKGRMQGRYSLQEFKKQLKKYGLDGLVSVFNIKWDTIKNVEPVGYKGWVYDFVVPESQNFAAGLGGIITHNSASFAGQQETYLNVRGVKELQRAAKKCIASLFTDRAISYREDKGFSHFDVALSVGVQKMVRSDLASSGVIFTLDTETGFDKVIYITGSWGLGEMVVQGKVGPDEFYVFKPGLKQGYRSVISKNLGDKKRKIIYDQHGAGRTKEVPVEKEERKKFILTDDEILTLARWGQIIEEHFSNKAGQYQPMDLEWAKDGKTNQLFILQARPETVHAIKEKNKIKNYVLKEKGEVLTTGQAVGKKIASGPANIIKDVSGIESFQKGEILVTEMTDPDWEPIMKIAGGIITNKGGRVSHAAIVSRELGIPCIVGTRDATTAINQGQEVTISCSEGEEGKVYKGKLEYDIEEYQLEKIPKTKTKIMVNIGSPGIAFENHNLPVEGVGLAREEFIIASQIKIHPMALIDYNELKLQITNYKLQKNSKFQIQNSKRKEIVRKIDKLTQGYKNKEEFFVERLAFGIAKIGAAFWPNPVIVRFSDFKTNEYRSLVGGELYEPKEENPMLGWRGASRYMNPQFKQAFSLECKAIQRVRDTFGLSNVDVMVPFCRTPEEGRQVVKIMAEFGLEKREEANPLNIYVMCEIPSNVILADQFLQIFDGFSIGSNDLTQLTLGLDRDSEIVSGIADERSPALKEMVEIAIKKCKEYDKYSGICGQAPSDYEEFAQFLVKQGIQSISLNPDTVIRMIEKIAEWENSR